MKFRARLTGSGAAQIPEIPGLRDINVLRIASNVADTQTVTIGRDVYEFDRAADGVTAGRIAVTGHADDTPANATAALVAAINTKGTEPFAAVTIGNNEVLIYATRPGALGVACAETLAGTNNVWSAATTYGGSGTSVTVPRLGFTVRVPTATEVALDQLHAVFDFEPAAVFVSVRVTATGAVKAFDGAVTVTGTRVTVVNSGATDWATTDTVTILAVG